ncbi:MAG TPA: hypothetical protein VMB71_06225, partial [Acetobacteraceae bacterium]|nr:hypothetical protein [Acetobacteraceae bacterium]
AVAFATGSLAPAAAQTPAPDAATSAPAAPDQAAPAPQDQSAAPADEGSAAPADHGSAAPAPTMHHRRHHRAAMAADQTASNDMGGEHWAHEPGTGESGPASARASNLDQADTHSDIAPHLPQPAVGAGADPDAYLRAAQSALAAHRTGAAQQALEMAETRLLDRSTPVGSANQPDESGRIQQVTQARKALASGDTAGAQQAIQTAMNGGAPGNGGMSPGASPQ